MNTHRTARQAAAFALSAVFTLAMLTGVGALFGPAPQAVAAAGELARAPADAPAQVVVIEGKRIARS